MENHGKIMENPRAYGKIMENLRLRVYRKLWKNHRESKSLWKIMENLRVYRKLWKNHREPKSLWKTMEKSWKIQVTVENYGKIMENPRVYI